MPTDNQLPQQPSVPSSSSQPLPVAPQSSPTATPQKRVLIVEDDGFLREIYLESLSRSPYFVGSAIDGEDALVKIKQGGWDLVLLDIVMPKMDGLDVVKKLQTDSTLQGKVLYKKLVFLTNLDNDIDMKEAQKLGNGYIVKSSITPGELLAKVQAYLAS